MSNIIPDIPRFYTALAEWSACLIYIFMLRRRFKGWKMALAAVGMLVVQSLFLMLTGSVPLGWWVPCMAGAVGLMFFFIWACCDVSALDAGYCCVRAFVLAELAASLEWQFHLFFFSSRPEARLIWQLLLLEGVYALIFASVWLLEKRQMPPDWRLGIRPRELCNAMIIGVAVFFISNLSFLSGNTPFSGQYPAEILNIRTMVDIGGFAILFAHCLQCCQARARRELEAMQNILQNQYVQYQQSRESIELINRKYHDLKHQIAALRAENDPQKRNAFLDAMESDIKAYEAQNKTGNTVLDTVLTGKSLYCQKHGIGLTCVADGTLLNFMDVMDICTIFGNALDNAIECEKKVADKEKRLIHVTVSQQKGFLLLRFENYYEGSLQFSGGLPVTTKRDVDYHGYGLKSVRYTAQKYGGTVNVRGENGWFELTVLIPIGQ